MTSTFNLHFVIITLDISKYILFFLHLSPFLLYLCYFIKSRTLLYEVCVEKLKQDILSGNAISNSHVGSNIPNNFVTLSFPFYGYVLVIPRQLLF